MVLLTSIADQLRQAEVERKPIDPITNHHDLSVEQAYAIQRINLNAKIANGRKVVGHKIGLTSKAMQDLLGVTTPDVGTITDEMVVEPSSNFNLDELIAGHIEAEFAFTLDKPLKGDKIDANELKQAISHVGLAGEIIDSRIKNWEIQLIDTVADNASSARVVIGDMIPATEEILNSLPQTKIHLHENEQVIAQGLGQAVMGDPLVPLLWLANALGEEDIHLKAGDIIFAGSVHRMQPLIPATYTVSAEGFASVSFTAI